MDNSFKKDFIISNKIFHKISWNICGLIGIWEFVWFKKTYLESISKEWFSEYINEA